MAVVLKEPNLSKSSKEKIKNLENHFFQEITEAVPALIGVYNIKNGDYMYVNDAIEKILGYKKNVFLDGGLQFVSSLVHPDDVKQMMEENQKALILAQKQKIKNGKDKMIVEFEYRMRHKNGSYIWLKTYGSVFKRTPEGMVLEVLNVSLNITKRKDAEERAIEVKQDRQVSSIIEHMSDAFLAHDKNGNYLYVNEKAAQMLGRDKKDFEGKNVWKLYPNLRRSSLFKAVNEVVRENKPMSNEYFSEEGKKWLLANIYPTDEGVSIYFTDISERKRAEDGLKKSEERYRAFVANSTEGIWRFELEQPVPIKLPVEKQIELFYKHAYLAECNDAFAKMYGYSSGSQLVGARLVDFMPKNDKTNIEYLSAFIKSNYRLNNAESHELDRKNKSKYFQNNLVGIIEDGKAIRAWGTQRDVTKLKEAEDALKTSEERLALALNSSQMGIWDWDIQNNIIRWSEQLEKIFGLTPGSFKGTFEHYVSLLHKDDRERLRKTIASALKTGKQYQVEHRVIWPDGTTHWIIGMGRAYFDPKSKKPVRMTGSSQNIDVRKLIEQRKDDFIGMASHELKTPVTSLKIFTQILRRQFEVDGKKSSVKYLEKMDDQINKLTRLIRELLDVSKISAGKLQITTTHFDIVDLTKEIVEYFQETTKQKITLLLPPKMSVNADRDRVGQVIINLLTNALKYSPKRSEVIIKIGHQAGNVMISIQDFGVGISKEHQERVFERFYQISPPSESATSGLGMGLYIAYQIVALHNGKLWVESSPGKGSIFTFTFPSSKKI